jgi:hypothetical protein
MRFLGEIIRHNCTGGTLSLQASQLVIIKAMCLLTDIMNVHTVLINKSNSDDVHLCQRQTWFTKGCYYLCSGL